MNPARLMVIYNPLAYDVLPFAVLRKVAAAGFDVLVVVPTHFGFTGNAVRRFDLPGERARSPELRIEALPLVHPSNRLLRTLFRGQLGKLMYQWQPTVIHCINEVYSPSLTQALIAKWHAAPRAKIVNYNADNLRQAQPPFPQLAAINARHLAAAPVLSTLAEQVLGSYGSTAPTPRLPLCADLDIFTYHERLPSLPYHLVFAGRLVPEKGVDVLIRALASLPPHFRVTLAGDGPAEPALRRLIGQHHLEGRVTFAGALDRIALAVLFRVGHALVLPSVPSATWIEQFGRVLLEAMASGLPVVGSRCGAIPEVIGDTGLVFEAGSATDLAAQLAQLFDDEALYMRLCRAGRVRAQQHFSTDAMAGQLVAIYQGL